MFLSTKELESVEVTKRCVGRNLRHSYIHTLRLGNIQILELGFCRFTQDWSENLI